MTKVGKLTQAQLRSIAETKMPDLNAHDVEPGDAGDRRHGALDGRGGGRVSGHGKRYKNARAEIDREKLYAPVEAIEDPEGASRTRSSTRRSRRTSASASTSATPTSSCAAR